LLRKETVGTGPHQQVDTVQIARFEVLDGQPGLDEDIPCRFPLSSCQLGPTYPNVHGKFSVHYYLNLVIEDEHEQTFFKPVQVFFWRHKV
jgi:hypothetical protein